MFVQRLEAALECCVFYCDDSGVCLNKSYVFHIPVATQTASGDRRDNQCKQQTENETAEAELDILTQSESSTRYELTLRLTSPTTL